MATEEYQVGYEAGYQDGFNAAQQPQAESFQPDWVNYRQGLRDGWAEGYEQGIADERISEANIGIAGFGAKVNPARENPYKNTAPQQAEAVPSDVVRDAERWRTFLATRPANTHAVINDAIDAAMAKGEKS